MATYVKGKEVNLPLEAKHVPTPWECREENGYYGIDTGNPKEQIANTSFDGSLDKANAEFIVRAVNSHDALLEELKEQKTYMEQQVFVPGFSHDSRAPLAQKRYLKLCNTIYEAEGGK